MPSHSIYLVRHAKAEAHASDDASRRLTPEGRARFVRHLAALRPRLAVSRVVTSPFVRARETAELLARATGAPLEEDRQLASGASEGDELLAMARAAAPGTALVGHNPEIAEAIAGAAGADFLGCRQLEVKPGTVAELVVDGRSVRLAWLEAPPRD